MSRIARQLRAHPVAFALLAFGAIAGGVGGALIPADVPLGSRILGGAIAGFYFALFPLGSRLFD